MIRRSSSESSVGSPASAGGCCADCGGDSGCVEAASWDSAEAMSAGGFSSGSAGCASSWPVWASRSPRGSFSEASFWAEVSDVGVVWAAGSSGAAVMRGSRDNHAAAVPQERTAAAASRANRRLGPLRGVVCSILLSLLSKASREERHSTQGPALSVLPAAICSRICPYRSRSRRLRSMATSSSQRSSPTSRTVRSSM